MPDLPEPRESRMTRRDFSRRAASAAAGLLVGGVLASAEEPAAPAVPATEKPSVSQVVAQIVARCPGLPEKDRKELETQVEGVLSLAQTLRGFSVRDGAEPDFVFRATREAMNAR